jgi:hypothetical protein
VARFPSSAIDEDSMSDVLLASLAGRLDALELECRGLKRENRRWRLAATLLGLVALMGVGLGAMQGRRPRVVEAEQFVLKDKDGKSQATLGMDREGRASLQFLDGPDKVRLWVGVTPEREPTIVLNGRETEAGLMMSVHGKGREEIPELSLFNHQGEDGLDMKVFDDGSPALNLYDRDKHVRIALIVMNGQMAGINLLDETGQPRLYQAMGPDNAPALGVKDKAGKVIFRVPKE